MISKFNLNCLVFGDHPRNIFPVKITSTDTVGDLKDLIKEKKPAFRDLAADTLQLWKITRNHYRLHIVVQPLPAGVSRKAGHLSIKLNCLVLCNHPWNIFPVEIVSTEVVGNLKDLIKEKNKHEFNNFDAKDLKLWKVDLPIDDTFNGNLNELEVDHKKPLSPVDGMSEVFDSPPQHKHLHIVVRHQ